VVFTSTQDVYCTGVMIDKCKTGNCDAENTCVCSTGVSNFLGGVYCDQPAHYCANNTNFYCLDNDGNTTCVTMADGSPTCSCHLGYTGAKCEIVGTACGVGFCYNNATCLNGATCDCLPDWKGNANCSLATPAGGDSGGSSIKWWGGLLIAGAVVAAVSVGVVFGVKKYKERTEGANRFNELKKSQMRARADSDDEYDSDPYEDEVHAKNSTMPQP